MIIVTGSLRTTEEQADDLLAVCVEHVQRSRAEPGCISHNVHRDVEDPLRIFFYERWADVHALRAHFAVPESGAFVTALASMCSERPEMAIYTAEPATV